ncbi:hypothetical protein DPU24_25400 [Salmonella enterica subsp. enterica serovar Oranienburg]|nr:hypothetical protein [Salmonella enterica subsp. enterica serovar Oranienburg]HAK8204829.1 hypothetical protein [Salmonella enterica]
MKRKPVDTKLKKSVVEWIFSSGKAVSIYDVAQRFGVTTRQAMALLTSIEHDNAILTQRSEPVISPSGRYSVRTVTVKSFDAIKMSGRRKNTYQYSIPDDGNFAFNALSRAEKWELLTSPARRKKHQD